MTIPSMHNCEHLPESRVLRLCLLKGSFAYFTTEDPAEAWGTNWDRPYSGDASSCAEPPFERGGEVKTLKVAFEEGSLLLPDDPTGTGKLWRVCPYSVQDVNRGKAPWLRYSGTELIPSGSLKAGATVREFVEFVLAYGGSVYLPHEIIAGLCSHRLETALLGGLF